MTKERKLLANRIITPDGTMLQSHSTHDYIVHTDTVTGEDFMVDGGLAYCRGSVNTVPATPAYVYSDDPHDKIREAFCWGTRGKGGMQPVKYVPLKDLDTDHIEAIIKTQLHISETIRNVFTDELILRGNK